MESENQGAILGSGKSLPATQSSSNTTTIQCPECGSQKTWKDELRYMPFGEIQRYLCRECFYRFSVSESSERLQRRQSLILKRANNKTILGLVGAAQTAGAKNLAETETRTQDKAAGATLTSPVSTMIIDYAWQSKKKGLAESTIKQRVYRLKLLVKKGANLADPDNVLTVLATNNWTDKNKRFFIVAYQSFAITFNIPWSSPKTRVERKLPFIPTEEEIDQLIAGCGKKTATFLQVLKATGARTAEALKLRWTEVDEKSHTIRINHPVKGSLARIIKVTPQTIAMINEMPKQATSYSTATPTRHVKTSTNNDAELPRDFKILD